MQLAVLPCLRQLEESLRQAHDRTRLMLVVMVMATPRELFLLQEIAAMDWFGRASQHVKDWEFLGFDTA